MEKLKLETKITIGKLPAGIKNIVCDAFKGCSNLKTIYVPAKKVDYYEKRIPTDLCTLTIVELPAEKKTKTKK